MKVVDSKVEMARLCLAAPRPLGLVPTMGYLHPGHMALVSQARRDCLTTVATIFVNPTQFAPDDDLASYPRDMARDLAMLEEAGVDMVFTPNPAEMYPVGFNTWVDVLGLAQGLEGLYRPGHFRGVATVVTKLLNIVRPDRAYFGQKDGQQAAIITQLARDLDTMAEIVVVPTVREADGLACSSRNAYLNPDQRAAATVIYRALTAGQALWSAGQRESAALADEVRRVLDSEPLVNGTDYVSLADADTLEELAQADRRTMLSMAVYIGRVRLIDNVVLE